MLEMIIDSREQQPWDFDFFPHVTTKHAKLETGDYTLVGMEKVFVIERKKSVSEIAANIGSDRTRFEAELDRIAEIKYSHLICEFSIDDVLKFPVGSEIPKFKWASVRIKGKFILKTLYGYQDKYGLKVHFCDDREAAIKKAVEVSEYAYKMVNG